MNPMRLLLAWILVLPIAFAGCGGGGGGDDGDGGGGGGGGGAAPVIGTPTVGPRLLDAAGGNVTIRVVVTDADGDPLTVTVAITTPEDPTPLCENGRGEITLTLTEEENTYEGTACLPANVNKDGSEITYRLQIVATDGRNEQFRDAGSITVRGLQVPPPAPG
jgi:hypothetical protein